MAKSSLPSIEELRQLLRHDADTGLMFWREKPEAHVASDRPSTRQRIARNWNARFAGKPAFTNVSKRGYLNGVINCKRYYAHRVIWALHYGKWPALHLDHINGDPLDNRISNLREVTVAQNLRNQSISAANKTGFHGVWYDKARDAYQAYITQDGTRYRLGRFKLLEDAVAARKAAESVMDFHPNHGRPRTSA